MSDITVDKRARKWLVTLNNPKDYNYSHDVIKSHLADFKGLLYWCMVDEVGEQGTYHTHIYMCSKNGIKFSTMKKHFLQAHLDFVRGSSEDNRNYCLKAGKWAETKKAETTVDGTFEEWGELPLERQGERTDISDLYGFIKEGMTNYEIFEQSPSYILLVDKIDKIRQDILSETYRDKWRNLVVRYIYGKSGAGKSRGIMEYYGYRNVYRVTDYTHPFDNYSGQDVVVFEEFRSSLKLSDMLNYLDGYPLELPCRFRNKYACFTKVFIVSNIPLFAQYDKCLERETKRAFYRRIHLVAEYLDNQVAISHNLGVEWGFTPCRADEYVPFWDTNKLYEV